MIFISETSESCAFHGRPWTTLEPSCWMVETSDLLLIKYLLYIYIKTKCVNSYLSPKKFLPCTPLTPHPRKLFLKTKALLLT